MNLESSGQKYVFDITKKAVWCEGQAKLGLWVLIPEM